VSRTFARGALLVACALAAFVATSSPALALRARGRTFARSFAAPGVVRGVAVDEATGHVYVSLGRNTPGCPLGCVDELEVSPGGEAKVVRTLQVFEPRSIAVDNDPSSPSHHDVYVAGETKKAAKEEEEEAKTVYKFAATGAEPIAKIKRFKVEKGEAEAFEGIEGLAVDSTGKLFVYDEEAVIARFNNAEKNKSLLSVESEFATPTPGLAVDSQGKVYVGHESEVAGAEGPTGQPAVIGKCEIVETECEKLVGELDQESTTAVAVDGANEAFLVGNATVKGAKTTSLVAFTAAGDLIQRLTAPNIGEGDAIAVNSTNGSIYVADATSNTIDVFEPEPEGPPRIDSVSACVTTKCSPESAGVRLIAAVDQLRLLALYPDGQNRSRRRLRRPDPHRRTGRPANGRHLPLPCRGVQRTRVADNGGKDHHDPGSRAVASRWTCVGDGLSP
jgi:DNA-binding beta-propeller fold protein YncE